MSSSEKKTAPTSERNEKLPSSTIERNEKLASIQSLLEKELELEESLLNEELSGDGVKNICESKKTDEGTEKNANTHKPEDIDDSDPLVDDFKLRWDEDDEEPKDQVNILDEMLSSIGGESNVDAGKIDLTSQEDVMKAIEDEEKLLDDLEIENKLVQSPKSTCSQHVFKSGLGLDKPDIMLEIPSQELIECSDDEDGEDDDLDVSPGTLQSNLNNDSLSDDKLLASDDEISPENPALDIDTDRTNLQVEEKDVMEENSSKTITVIDEAKLAADILTKELSSMDTEAVTELDEELLLQDDSNDVEEERMRFTNELGVVQIDKQQEEDSIDIELQEQIETIRDNRNMEEAMDDSGDSLSLSEDLNVTSSNIVGETTGLTESGEHTDVEMRESVKVPEIILESISSEKSVIEPLGDTECDSEEANVNPEENILLESDENMHVLKDIQQDSTENETNETEEQVCKDALDHILDINAKKNLEIESTESQSVVSDLPSIKVVDPQPADMETSDLSPVMKKQSQEALDSQPSTSFDISDQDPEPTTSGNEKNENTLFGSSAENIDVPEMADSLGLLAESCRVMEEDEDQDDDDEVEDDDEFDHYQDDESSSLVTAEHSEDSNAQHSETDAPKSNIEDGSDDITLDTDLKSELDCNEIYKEDKIQIISEGEGTDSNQNEPENQKSTDKEKDLITPKESLLKNLLMQNDDSQDPEKQSPTKISKLEMTKVTTNVFNIVDLEESSDEDEKTNTDSTLLEDVARVVEDESVDDDSKIKSVAEPAPSPVEELSSDDATTTTKRTKPPIGLEVFNLDSDDEEPTEKIKDEVDDNIIINEQDQKKEKQLKLKTIKCINKLCTKMSEEFYIANMQAIKFYEVDRIKRCYVCPACNAAVDDRNLELIAGIQNMKPLLEIRSQNNKDDLVEISDSESEEEEEFHNPDDQLIGEDAAEIEEKLGDMFNEVWDKYKMDVRLEEAQDSFLKEVERLKNESKELNDLMNDCQAATDHLRNEIYETFRPKIVKLTPLEIYDTPTCSYTCPGPPNNKREIRSKETSVRQKRSLSPTVEIPAKRPAIPLGYTPLDKKNTQETITDKMDDDLHEVSVVELSTESAPPDLPPLGDLDLTLAPLKLGMSIFAMRNAFGSWLPAKIVEMTAKSAANPFTLCRVKFEERASKQPFKTLQARYLAYAEPPEVRMTIGRRVIALFKDAGKKGTYYSGVIAEMPNPVNKYRYLVFFDDGYAQYAPHSETRLVCECSPLVWEEVHLYSRDFVMQYLQSYPERPMVRLHAGQNLKTEWRGKWWSSRVSRVDASLVEVQFLKIARREWIYRGSTRLAPLFLELKAAERHRPRAMPRTQVQARTNMPYVEYTRTDEQNKLVNAVAQSFKQQQDEIRRRAVAKKSTSTILPQPKPLNSNLDNICSRVVYYTPKSAVKPYKMVPHVCSPQCKRTDVLALKDLRTYNPLTKPLLSGWERLIVRWKGHRDVIYRAPCGRRLRDMRELHKYLRDVQSDMAVDLFDFSPNTHCLAEFVLNNCNVGKKDLSHGKENVPVPCVNYYDETLPEFCIYNIERTPTAGVPLNLDPEFLCGCDCEDDCEDKSKCACWKMTLEGARTIGLEGDNVGYVYKRLPEPLPSGIYECNSRCKCKHTCLNRVAQHPLQLKLQVFKTENRGWGIRALNDVPKGAFLCVYAGNLLTDATANTDGLTEGDEYLAELDYIEVLEQMKEGYEEDIPEKIKKLDKKELSQQSGESEEESSEEESNHSRNEQEDDDDFQPGYISESVTEFNKRLRRRNAKKDKEEDEKEKEKEKEGQKENEADKEKDSEKDKTNEPDKGKDSDKDKKNEADKGKDRQKDKDVEKKIDDKNPDEDCITISDDEEVREPSCFTAAVGMDGKEFVPKHRSVRTLFGEDEACYIVDAKVQGNIGRYLNHSCSPNVFVQNVFVDTHDPRFPWVAFFALSHIRAGTELTWNYNYDIGSVPGKVMYCLCGSANCRGRLL